MAGVLTSNPHLFLGSRLKRLAEQMQADASAFTQRAGLSVPPGMFAVLATLDERGPQTIGQLADQLGVSQPAMTKTVRKLTDIHLVHTTRSGIDRRQSAVDMTDVGRDAILKGRQHIWPLVDHAVQDIIGDLCGPLLGQLDEIERRLAVRSISDRAAAKAPVVLRPASNDDISAIVQLLNHAYRGAGADASWNSEAAYMDGDRTNDTLLRDEMADNPMATMLVWEPGGTLQGCVWLNPLEGGEWYLGSLAVSPSLQNAQAGRRLLRAAEDWVLARHGTRIRLTVVNLRRSLIAWYERRGYQLTGETAPFPYSDERFGVPRRPDLCFVELARNLDETELAQGFQPHLRSTS